MGMKNITITWNGETKTYCDVDWIQPRVEAFKKFLYDHENDDLEVIKNWLSKEQDDLMSISLIKDKNDRGDGEAKNATFHDAKEVLNEHLKDRMKVAKTNYSYPFHYDPEYDEPTLMVFVIDEIAKLLGWGINTFHKDKYDPQVMEIMMGRANTWDFSHEWRCTFRNPEFLTDRIDLDSIFEKAKKKLEKYEHMQDVIADYYCDDEEVE